VSGELLAAARLSFMPAALSFLLMRLAIWQGMRDMGTRAAFRRPEPLKTGHKSGSGLRPLKKLPDTHRAENQFRDLLGFHGEGPIVLMRWTPGQPA
jgi:hypothetical protein